MKGTELEGRKGKNLLKILKTRLKETAFELEIFDTKNPLETAIGNRNRKKSNFFSQELTQ